MAKTHLFLFDIDGTLIASGGAGLHAMELAVQDCFGEGKSIEGIEIAGRTDSHITRSVLQKFGFPWSAERATAFLDAYLRHLAEQLPIKQGRLLPGILPLLDALKADPRVALALLTGNLERGARLKLTHYGVWEYFEFGAYADDDADRDKLGPYAQSRARARHGIEFAPKRTFVLGDTPHDIACGKIIGAKTIVVATGGYTKEQLMAHAPTFYFDDFGQPEKFFELLGR